MKISIYITLFIFSMSAYSQTQHGGLGAAAMASGILHASCDVLADEILSSPSSQPAGEVIRRVQSRLNIEVRDTVSHEILNFITAKKYTGMPREVIMQDCGQQAVNWFARDTEDVVASATALTAASLVEYLGDGNKSASEEEDIVLPVVFDRSCEIPSEMICQIEIPILPPEINGIERELRRYVTINIPSFNFTDPCRCLQQSVDRAYPDEEIRTAKIDEAKNTLSRVILQDAGKKFLDDLASNYEDANFFKNLPDRNKSTPAQYCTNPTELESELGSGCNASDEQKRERLRLVFNSLGPLSSANDISGIMSDFNQRVSQLETPGTGAPYTRDQFDVRRISLSNDNSTFRAMDSILAKMLSHSDVREKISRQLAKDPNRTPYEAMMRTLVWSIRETDSLPSYFNISGLDEEKQSEIRTLLSQRKFRELGMAIHRHVSYAMTIHPGIGRVLSSRESYNRILPNLPANLTSLKAFTENTSSAMNEDFRDECNQLKNRLKNLICSSPDDILKGISQRQLAAIIEENSPTSESRELNNLMMCMNPPSETGPQFGNQLRRGDYSPAMHSDLRARVDDADIPSAIELLYEAEQVNQNVRDEISVAVLKTELLNPGWADRIPNRFFGDRGGRLSSSEVSRQLQNLAQNTSRANTRAPASESEVSDEYASTSNYSQSQSQVTAPVSANQYSGTSVANPSAGNVASANRNETQVRFQPSESFEERFNREEISRLKSNLTDEQRMEIERLREQLRSDQARLDELRSQNQLAKIENLRNQLNDLEERRDEKQNSDRTQNRSDDDNRDSSVENAGPISGSARQIASAVASPQTAIPDGGSAAGSSGSLSAGSVVSGGGVSAASATSRATSPALIISSQEIRNGDIESSELSQEVIRYLTQNNPDLSVLTQIKENGMLYRFRTIQNGTTVEKEVFIQFDRLTPEARSVVEAEIAKRNSVGATDNLEQRITNVRRSYSYEALKFIVAEEISRER